MTIFPRVLELMRAKGLDEVVLFGGGIIPEEDVRSLRELGVGEIFLPGTPTTALIDFIHARSA